MRVIYTGPAQAVRVPDAGGRLFERGKPTEVPAAVGRRLLTQEHWRTPTRRRRSKNTDDKE